MKLQQRLILRKKPQLLHLQKKKSLQRLFHLEKVKLGQQLKKNKLNKNVLKKKLKTLNVKEKKKLRKTSIRLVNCDVSEVYVTTLKSKMNIKEPSIMNGCYQFIIDRLLKVTKDWQLKSKAHF